MTGLLKTFHKLFLFCAITNKVAIFHLMTIFLDMTLPLHNMIRKNNSP